MGIKSLHKFFKKKCPTIYNNINLSILSYKIIAIDISLYLYKYKFTMGDHWLSAFIKLILTLRKNNIHCVFIYDGKAPIDKQLTQEKRTNRTQTIKDKVDFITNDIDKFHKEGIITDLLSNIYEKNNHKKLLKSNNCNNIIKYITLIHLPKLKNQLISISSDDIQITKKLFDILGVPYITAPSEAEKMCSLLCKQGLVDCVLSEDTDVIAYRAPIFLTKLNTYNETCEMIVLEEVLNELDFDENMLLDFCIMCGTDYNSNIFRIGPNKAYTLITNNYSIDELPENIDKTVLKHQRVRELFSYDNIDNIDIPYCKEPDFEKLEDFIIDNNISLKMCIEDIRKIFVIQEDIILIEDGI
jgi:5'-3' exonuclease